MKELTNLLLSCPLVNLCSIDRVRHHDKGNAESFYLKRIFPVDKLRLSIVNKLTLIFAVTMNGFSACKQIGKKCRGRNVKLTAKTLISLYT